MGSLLLFVLGVAAPLIVALVVLLVEDKRRSRLKAFRHKIGNAAALQSILRSSVPEGATAAVGDAGSRQAAARPAPAVANSLGLNDREAAALKDVVAEWGVDGIVSALDRLKGRLAAVAEMEMIWADPHSPVAQEQGDMLERALWVFEPEYVVGEGRVGMDARYGAVAKPVVGAGLVPGHHIKEGEPVLVVELKNARVTIGADEQQRAWANVRDLIRSGAVKERDQVDVFVVGGSVDELDGNPRIEGRYRNVRINSYDYSQFVTRAKRLTFGLYDELKDNAPFLRVHREEILAAQQAAAEQAAAEAAAPVAEEPVQEAPRDERSAAVAEEDDLVRREDFTDVPRRGEYSEAEAQEEPAMVGAPAVSPAPRHAHVPPVLGRQRGVR
jgi:hypothetical protein